MPCCVGARPPGGRSEGEGDEAAASATRTEGEARLGRRRGGCRPAALVAAIAVARLGPHQRAEAGPSVRRHRRGGRPRRRPDRFREQGREAVGSREASPVLQTLEFPVQPIAAVVPATVLITQVKGDEVAPRAAEAFPDAGLESRAARERPGGPTSFAANATVTGVARKTAVPSLRFVGEIGRPPLWV